MEYHHTFVICAYGDSPFLEDCILSLKAQTVASLIIIYTSTPSDYIQKIAEKHKVSVHTALGGGIGKDWNHALSFVNTPYATIAHQDDIYLPSYSQTILAVADSQPDAMIIYTDYAELQNGLVRPENTNLKIKRLMLNVLSWYAGSRIWRNRVLAFGNPICCPAVTYNMSRLEGFRFNEALKTSLDWHAWYTISNEYNGKFAYISDKLMHHRIHDESETTATIADKTRTKEDLWMYEQFWPKWVAKKLIRFYEKSQATNQ